MPSNSSVPFEMYQGLLEQLDEITEELDQLRKFKQRIMEQQELAEREEDRMERGATYLQYPHKYDQIPP